MLRRFQLSLSLSLLMASAVWRRQGQISGRVTDRTVARFRRWPSPLPAQPPVRHAPHSPPVMVTTYFPMFSRETIFRLPTRPLNRHSSIGTASAESLRQDLALQVGQVTESVTVEASSALLQADNSALGTVVPAQTLSQMPLNSRNYLSLVAVSANTNTLSTYTGQANARQGGQRAQEAISVGGQRIMYDHFTIDGINNTDVDFNTFVVQPTVDAIQEMKVQTGVYPAQYGYNATQVNVVTKSGGNAYHGTAFYFLRNNYADARGYNTPRSRFLLSYPSDITITDSCSMVHSRFPNSSTPKTSFSSWSIRSGFPKASRFKQRDLAHSGRRGGQLQRFYFESGRCPGHDLRSGHRERQWHGQDPVSRQCDSRGSDRSDIGPGA